MNGQRLSRRQFGSRFAAATLAVAASRGALRPAPPVGFEFRHILGSSMYGRLKLATILPEVAKCGAAHIDIWPLSHGDQREQLEQMGHDVFAALLREHGVKLGMITQYPLGPFGLGDEIKVLRKLGGKLIVTGSRGRKDVTGEDARSEVKAFLEKMKPHVAAAEEAGAVIAIENHGSAMIASPDSIRYFAEFNRSKHIGIALAPYHLPQDPRLIAGLIKALGPSLAHFYAWEHGKGANQRDANLAMLQLPGVGKLDFRPICAALEEIDYRGWTEIFMHPTPRGIPILPTATECTAAINRSRAYLEKCLQR